MWITADGYAQRVASLADYPLIAAGKVRELYAVGDEHLLFVASDRISAYDFVLDTPIPDSFEAVVDAVGADRNRYVDADGDVIEYGESASLPEQWVFYVDTSKDGR